jgi:hypothetical protein
MKVLMQFNSFDELYKVLREPYLVRAVNRAVLGDLAIMVNRQISKSFLFDFQNASEEPFDFDFYIEWLCEGFDGDFFVIKRVHLEVEPLVGSIGCPFEVVSRIEFLKAFLAWYVKSEKINLFTLDD